MVLHLNRLGYADHCRIPLKVVEVGLKDNLVEEWIIATLTEVLLWDGHRHNLLYVDLHQVVAGGFWPEDD